MGLLFVQDRAAKTDIGPFDIWTKIGSNICPPVSFFSAKKIKRRAFDPDLDEIRFKCDFWLPFISRVSTFYLARFFFCFFSFLVPTAICIILGRILANH